MSRSFYELSDEEVVALAQDGDTAALEHIIGRYRNLVHMRARSYFLIGADKDDIIQEGMIGLYEAVKSYQHQKASFKAFASVCVFRKIISAVKSATRQKHIPLNSYVSLDQSLFDSEDDGALGEVLSRQKSQDPESILINQERMDGIEHQINETLSKLELEVLMYYLDGHSYQEIADLVQRDLKSVDNAIQRIKKKIEGIFNGRD